MTVSYSSIKRKAAVILGQIPGPFEAYIALCDLVNQPPVADSAWRHLPKWLDDLNRFRPSLDGSPNQRLLVYSNLPSHVDYSLALSVVLMSYDVAIDFAWSSHPSYHIETLPNISYSNWFRAMKRISRRVSHPLLRLIDLDMLAPYPSTDVMRAISTQQALIDTSYVVLRERIHIDTDPTDRCAYEFRVERNLEAVTKVARLLDTNQYDRVLLLNGAILEFGAVYNYVRSKGLPTSTLEVGPGYLIVSNGDTVMGMDASDLWQRDKPHVLSDARRTRVQALIDKRQRPASNKVDFETFQLVGVASAERTRVDLGLRPDLPVVLICPNVPFDAAYYVQGNQCFSKMSEWMVKTVEYLVERNDCQVIVRSHPAEKFYQTSETTVGLIREFFPTLPNHIHVVSPEAEISTYSIMAIADLGIVFWSTTGLEMAMRGIPVVGGVPSVHYNGKGFTLDPGTPEDYFAYIDQVLRDPLAYRLTSRQVELAWCYFDVLFNQWMRPFPWRAGRSLWEDLRNWPMERMLSTEGRTRFGGVFQTLLGNSTQSNIL